MRGKKEEREEKRRRRGRGEERERGAGVAGPSRLRGDKLKHRLLFFHLSLNFGETLPEEQAQQRDEKEKMKGRKERREE